MCRAWNDDGARRAFVGFPQPRHGLIVRFKLIPRRRCAEEGLSTLREHAGPMSSFDRVASPRSRRQRDVLGRSSDGRSGRLIVILLVATAECTRSPEPRKRFFVFGGVFTPTPTNSVRIRYVVKTYRITNERVVFPVSADFRMTQITICINIRSVIIPSIYSIYFKYSVLVFICFWVGHMIYWSSPISCCQFLCNSKTYKWFTVIPYSGKCIKYHSYLACFLVVAWKPMI